MSEDQPNSGTSGQPYVPDGEYNTVPYPLFSDTDEPFDISFSAKAAREMLARTEDMRTQNQEQQTQINKLESETTVDPLTGLSNRRGLEASYQRLNFTQFNEKRGRQDPADLAPHSFVLLDVDNFKPVNEEHGHPIGDDLLVVISSALRDLCRKTDTVARLGGDEFVLLMPNTTPETAAEIVNKARRFLNSLENIKGKNITVGLSAGITEASPDLEETYRQADLAENVAKKEENQDGAQWKNHTLIYDPKMELTVTKT